MTTGADFQRWYVVVVVDGDRYETAELIPNAKPYPSKELADLKAVELRSAREDAAARALSSRRPVTGVTERGVA